MFAFVVLFPAWLLVKAIARMLCTGHCGTKCCYNWFLAPTDALPVFIIFLLESCLEIGLASAISISFMSDEKLATVWEAMSAFLAYAFAVALVVAPVYMITAGVRLYRAVQAKDEEQQAQYE